MVQKDNVPSALLIIDVQNDFLPKGSLAVPDADAIVQPINDLMKLKGSAFDLIVASQDWHPKGHASFASTWNAEPFSIKDLDGYPQTMWPDHCVQETEGAKLSKDLNAGGIDEIVFKGVDKNVDSYSAFFDNQKKTDLGLSKFLKDKGINRVYLTGVATDYCVRYSAEDAVSEGFETVLVTDATRGVAPGTTSEAMRSLEQKGVRFVTCPELLEVFG